MATGTADEQKWGDAMVEQLGTLSISATATTAPAAAAAAAPPAVSHNGVAYQPPPPQYQPPPPQQQQQQQQQQQPDTPADSKLPTEDDHLQLGTVEMKGDAQDSLYRAVSSFEELNLRPDILKGIYAMKYVQPSRIQAAALPMILKDPPMNLIGQSHNGTGKTATFVMSMLSRCDPRLNYPQALCICPTRELAIQTMAVIENMSKFTEPKITSLLVVPSDESKTLARQGGRGDNMNAHCIVGTPGKLKDVVMRRVLNVSQMRVFVLDEADEMLRQQGHKDACLAIKKTMPVSVQLLLFSATFADAVAEFAMQFAPRACQISVRREELTLPRISQFYFDCQSDDKKFEVLCSLYALCTISQSIIFVDNVSTAQRLAKRMTDAGNTVSLLHGRNMSPSERDRVMAEFRAGTTKVLVTTDVLARGTDVPQVSLVINYEVPLMYNEPGERRRAQEPNPETYIHRVGRAGRFGREGAAVNLVHDDQSRRWLQFISDYYSHPIKKLECNEADLQIIQNVLRPT